MDKIKLIARINKANNQINFSLPKNSLSRKIKDKLPSLKGITIKYTDLDFT